MLGKGTLKNRRTFSLVSRAVLPAQFRGGSQLIGIFLFDLYEVDFFCLLFLPDEGLSSCASHQVSFNWPADIMRME